MTPDLNHFFIICQVPHYSAVSPPSLCRNWFPLVDYTDFLPTKEWQLKFSWLLLKNRTELHLPNKTEFTLNDTSQKGFNSVEQAQCNDRIGVKKVKIGPLIVEYVSRVALVPLHHNGISHFTAVNIGGPLPHQRSRQFALLSLKIKEFEIEFILVLRWKLP